MDEQQVMEVLSQLPPEVLEIIIGMFVEYPEIMEAIGQLPEDQLMQILQQLQQETGGGAEQGPPPEEDMEGGEAFY